MLMWLDRLDERFGRYTRPSEPSGEQDPMRLQLVIWGTLLFIFVAVAVARAFAS